MTPNSRTPTTRSRPDPHYVSESSHDDTRDQRTGRPAPVTPPPCESIPICGLYGQPVMAQNHRSHIPAHAIPDRSQLSQPNQPRKSPGAHATTYTTRQTNLRQVRSHRQITGHACRDIHNPAYRVSTVPHNSPTAPDRPIALRIRHTSYADAYIIALRCCPRSWCMKSHSLRGAEKVHRLVSP